MALTPCYGAAGARGARVVVPPTKTASLSRRGARSGARDRTIRRVKALGRRRWKKASGYHQHARVENAFFRYKSIVGDGHRARSSSGQRREAVLACNVLNRMTELGRPVSYRIGRGRARRFEARRPARIRAPTPQPAGDVGVHRAVPLAKAMRDGFEGGEPVADLAHVPPDALRVPVVDRGSVGCCTTTIGQQRDT